MAYIKQQWNNNPPSATTPISAARLNHLETQYDEATSELAPTVSEVGALSVTVGSGRLSEEQLKAQFARGISVASFGATGNGTSDDTSAISQALAQGGDIYFPPGVYLVSDELKVPSNTTVSGSGMGETIVRMASTAPRHLNVFTNELNNRQPRTSYNESILIRDLTIDANALSRASDSTPWLGNGCGIMFSTVRNSGIERVQVSDAPLHCFSVDASWLPTSETGNQDLFAEGPSYRITIRDCIAINPLVDDGFTTHYSHDILIENCVASIDTINDESGGVQNGFEVDDGSWRVTVRDCYSAGWQNGFEAKGHSYAPAAVDIVFDNCISEGDAVSFTLSAGGDPKARGVVLSNCISISPSDIGTENNRETSLKLYNYSDVTVRNFQVRDSRRGGIILTLVGSVTFDGLYTQSAYTDPSLPTSEGFIRITGDSTTSARLTIRDLVMSGTPIASGSVIRNNATDSQVDIRVVNLVATGAASAPAISDSFYSNNRRYERLRVTGFSEEIAFRGGSGAVAGAYSQVPPMLSGSVSPQGVIGASPGTLYLRSTGGAGTTLYVKESGTGTSGWVGK